METLDATLLSRLQFAFTIAFHIVFPSMSIGIGLFLVIAEFQFLRTKNDLYQQIYKFWVVIFALGFGMGVVSGIVMSFQFGTNFSGFAQAVGPVIGPIIGMEVVTAFFLEAGFLGIMLFGWGKVGPRLHFAATCFVCIGTLISANFIMAANSWMHTPAGVVFENGRFVVTDWLSVIFNPSYPYRAIHMIMGAWITGAFFIAGISAWYLIKGRHLELARRSFSISLGLASILLPLQLYLGDVLAVKVMAVHQPAKVQAMEGFWETTPDAQWNVIIVPDQKKQENKVQIGIPYLGSIFVGKDLHTPIPGLKETPTDRQPRMWVVFYGFRLMFILGTLMFCAAMYSLYLRWRGRLFDARLFHRLMVILTPAGFLCVLGGWITSETGRQPYTVYGIFTTAQSVSPVAPGTVLFSLAMFISVYTTLLIAFIWLIYRYIRLGPADLTYATASVSDRQLKAPVGMIWGGVQPKITKQTDISAQSQLPAGANPLAETSEENVL